MVEVRVHSQGTGDFNLRQVFAQSIVVDGVYLVLGQGDVVDTEVVHLALEGSVVVGFIAPFSQRNGLVVPRADLAPAPIVELYAVHVDLNVGARVDVAYVAPAIAEALGEINFGIPAPVLGSQLAVGAVPEGAEPPKIIGSSITGLGAEGIESRLVPLAVFNVHP